MAALGRSLRRLLRTESIDLVHAHSPVLCGLPAVLVASARGIPTVYEVRGFWEDGFTDRWSAGERSIRYRLSRRLETFVFRRASAVVAISQRMVDEIAGRGIPREKLLGVPNGVDGQRFGPAANDSRSSTGTRSGAGRFSDSSARSSSGKGSSASSTRWSVSERGCRRRDWFLSEAESRRSCCRNGSDNALFKIT